MKFYKIRAIFLFLLTRFFGKVLFVEVPPVVSVAAIIENGGKVLFLNHTYIKGYGLPGGLVKSKENAEEALRREVKEETGLDITNLVYFISVESSSYHGIPTITLAFFGRVSGDMKESSEGSLSWLDSNEVVGKMAYGSGETIVQKYLNRKSF